MAAQHDGTRILHGRKRPAESDPDGDRPLAKRFNDLHIDPVALYNHHHHPHHHDHTFTPSTSQETPGSPDVMLLDDQKHKIYVQDLDRELAEVDLPGNSVVFLPGIEETWATVPRLMLADSKNSCNELVLYREPVSLLEPGKNSNVRRALVETRERARARQKAQVSPFTSVSRGTLTPSDGVYAKAGNSNETEGGDMMEIDWANT
ncbi:hypothetical protein N8T08_008328 [Aspergillus melleus]|uniref:Uncharacterized protein n=1 Tax=Aspergillus melleus TaxID=138277 RepID=A0ACC3AVR9_9EURO|nr:hypothetical protein N8T08_008328 [Aspergillus melleus]